MNRARQAGFTLIEIMIAMAIATTLMLLVSMTFSGLTQTHMAVENLTESTEAGSRILNLIERDLRGLWHHNIKENRVFMGRNQDIAGSPADRLDFLTNVDSVGMVLDTTDQYKRTTLCEVGYWLRQNSKNTLLMELWRREDPLVDNDLLTEGQFQLVHDRVRSFNITYYETLGHRAEEVFEWDSSKESKLPRRLKIEFTVERRLANRNRVADIEVEDFEKLTKTYVRHIVFDPRLPDILQPQVALVPVLPPKPVQQDAGAGFLGGGGGGPGGDGGGGGGGGGNAITDAFNMPPGFDASQAGQQGLPNPTGRPGGPGSPGGLPTGFFPGAGGGTSRPIDLNDLFGLFGQVGQGGGR